MGLVRKVTQADPQWMLDFITWLRGPGNMRTGAVVASVEAARVAKQDLQPGSDVGMARKLAQAGIGRADEVGEAVAYHMSKYGKKLPKPIKRGLADAMTKHVDEYTAMKYGSKNSSKEFSMGDLLNLLHPTPADFKQKDLFGYLVARQYGEVEIPTSLVKLRLRAALMAMPVPSRRHVLETSDGPQVLKDAGLTWEALAGWLQGPMDAKAWEAIIPSMGYMALLRNLRNFDEAGISQEVAGRVAGKLSHPEQVARSKQFPFRFLSAHRAVNNLRWASALSAALELSLLNIPKLDGRTLVLVDTSGSMGATFSEHSEMKRWDAAALFGIALALAGNDVDLYSYSMNLRQFKVRKGADTLGELSRWGAEGYNIGGGTATHSAVQATYRGHDRIILITDEQANYAGHYGGVDGGIPAQKHMFTFNLAGYAFGHNPTGPFRHAFGGLTDTCFRMVPAIEAGVGGQWPWEMESAA